ncbi:hypothetical protein [Caballeronia sp. NK8]|uniref:hypothetical protein n=1 Tax=Caballeronia sp. NK8 TaxID=140098 RepID=UPI001CECA474|nr:hypothetical protein [Caballeronia sp. NK8]
MSEMTIPEIAERLNQRAAASRSENFSSFAKTLKAKRLPSRKIFEPATTFEDWAFHYGGRAELQFNIGIEKLGSATFVRHEVAFSLEPSQTLPSIDILVPKVALFNDYLRSGFDAPPDFRMWYYKNGTRSENRLPTVITPDLIKRGVFIFLGAVQPIQDIDDDRILSDFDLAGGPLWEQSAQHARRTDFAMIMQRGQWPSLTATIRRRVQSLPPKAVQPPPEPNT